MLSSLAKRSSYRAIEEELEDQHQPKNIGNVRAGRNPLVPDEREEDQEDQSIFESAPPSHHGISVSFKCGETDSELQKSTDCPAQWDHVKDIDQFFAYIYEYYQHSGLTCIALRYVFSLIRFAFVVLFSTFLLQCVDYDILFYNRNTTAAGQPLLGKRGIQDAFIPQCYFRLNPLVVFCIILASIFWVVHLIRICYRLIQFYEIKQFFVSQLQIHDNELQNLSWSELVQKLCQVQQRLHLIVNKESITPLDIYQRILRHKNFFVALIYKDILPPQVRLPFLGPVRYLSTGLRFNLEWLLFWGPWSPWKGPYALKEDYKNAEMLPSISRNMQRTLAIMAFVNFVFFPFVFIYQLLFSFFYYSEHFQRDPNVFGMRKYSNYGREKLRHLNEMDHELDARLNRSYEFAARYTDQFISPLAKIVARNVAFVAASILVVLLALTAFDEDTLKIDHVTTMMTITGGIILICRVFIPNENLVFCQQFLMRQVVACIHYAPKSWLSNAHCTKVNQEFTQIFRLKMELLLEELLSPVLTPIILYFCIYKRVPEIVAFLHENTVHIEGLGDVCSLAQMDLVRDGDTQLASLSQSGVFQSSADKEASTNRKTGKSTCGKVELSLLNFATLHPSWVPPKPSAEFIKNVQNLVMAQMSNIANRREEEEEVLIGQPQNSSMDIRTLAFVQAGTALPLHQMQQSHYQLAGLVDTSLFPMQRQQQQNMAMSNDGQTDKNIASNSKTVSTQLAQQTGRNGALSNSNHSRANTNSMPNSFISSTLQAQQLPYAFTNSRLLASSFITPSPLATFVQPRVVQESNLRATEMSLHALVINHMLFLNNSEQNSNTRINNNRGGLGYGAIQLGSVRHGAADGSRYGGAVDSFAGSNIWGVPAETEMPTSRNAGTDEDERGLL